MSAAQPITPHQCRAGRKLLGWSGIDLAQRAQVDAVALIRFEDPSRRRRAGKGLILTEEGIEAVQDALEAGGILLGHGEVRLRQGLLIDKDGD